MLPDRLPDLSRGTASPYLNVDYECYSGAPSLHSLRSTFRPYASPSLPTHQRAGQDRQGMTGVRHWTAHGAGGMAGEVPSAVEGAPCQRTEPMAAQLQKEAWISVVGGLRRGRGGRSGGAELLRWRPSPRCPSSQRWADEIPTVPKPAGRRLSLSHRYFPAVSLGRYTGYEHQAAAASGAARETREGSGDAQP